MLEAQGRRGAARSEGIRDAVAALDLHLSPCKKM
jgi:hypothetical protein